MIFTTVLDFKQFWKCSAGKRRKYLRLYISLFVFTKMILLMLIFAIKLLAPNLTFFNFPKKFSFTLLHFGEISQFTERSNFLAITFCQKYKWLEFHITVLSCSQKLLHFLWIFLDKKNWIDPSYLTTRTTTTRTINSRKYSQLWPRIKIFRFQKDWLVIDM